MCMRTKRALSWLLSLALLLGLFTTAALADGGERTDTNQLYRVYTDGEGNVITESPKPETAFEVDATGSPAPLFAIQNDDGYTVIKGTDGWSVSYQSTDGTVTKTLEWESEADYEGWRWQSPGQVPSSTGTITATKDGASYSMPVTIGAAEVGVYTDKDAIVTAPGNAYVIPDGPNYTVDQSVKSVYLKAGYTYISIAENSESTPISSDNSNVTCTLADGVLTVTNGGDGQQSATVKFYVQFESDSEPSPWEYTIRFGAQQQSGEGDEGNEGENLKLESDSRDMKTTDYKTESDIPGAVAGFTYQGETYYMGPSLASRHLPGGDGAMNFALTEGEHHYKTYDIAFWTKQGEDYFLVTKELAATLAEQFSSLTLDVYALSADNAAKPEKYPALYSGEDTGYCCPTTLALGLENRATWVFIASGTIGDRTLTASCREKWEPVKKTTYTPNANSEDKIKDINTYLASLTPSGSTRVEITLPAGEHSGYIHVPNTPGLDIVVVTGEEGKTVTLNGGIYSETASAHAENIRFVGNGSTNASSSHTKSGTTDTKYLNRAIYGDERTDGGAGNGGAGGCTFTGYDIALYSRDCGGCTFTGNRVALYIDVPVGDLNGEIYRNTFQENTIAIQFADIDYRVMSDFTFDKNVFIENYTDIRNDTGKNLFAPGQFFGKLEDGKLEPCTCATDANVLYYPQAANNEFKPDDNYGGYAYIYDATWYYADKLVIWNNFAASWPIPKEYLSGKFTVMNSSGTAALGYWNFGGSQNGRPTGGRG